MKGDLVVCNGEKMNIQVDLNGIGLFLGVMKI